MGAGRKQTKTSKYMDDIDKMEQEDFKRISMSNK